MAPTHNLHSTMNEVTSGSQAVPEPLRFRNQQSMKHSSVKPTLQSVLRGEVPSAYMHLVKSQHQQQNHHHQQQQQHQQQQHADKNTMSKFSPKLHRLLTCESRTESYVRSVQSSNIETYIPAYKSEPSRCAARHSPEPSHHSSSWLEQQTSSYAEFTSQRNGSPTSSHDNSSSSSLSSSSSPASHSYHDRYSPAFENRSSPFSDSGSPFLTRETSPYYGQHSPRRVFSPYPPAGSPYLTQHSPPSTFQSYSVGDERLFNEDQPIDLSQKSDAKISNGTCANTMDSDCNQTSQNDGSLLRNLLNNGKLTHKSSTAGDRDSPFPEVCRADVPVTGTTRVTLAKKMMYPITSRVSDWLVKIVQFCKSIPEFASLSQNDKMTLLINAWTRLLLLSMAENDFEFAVTPLPAEKSSGDGTPSQDEPTMKSVDGIQSFIKKCKNMNLDQKEYALLRMSVLFNAGYAGLDKPELVERLSSAVHQLLQQHVRATRPCDVMHFSRILMSLPSLYGINCKMIENLFCARINSNMDMEVLLKEMLQKL